MPAVTVRRESALPASCPLREPDAMAAFRAAIRHGSDLSLQTRTFLAAKSQPEMGEWIRDVMEQSRVVFQPWSMETLFVTGVLGEVRFSELEAILGASSRTLTNKLRALTAAGLLERHVAPGPPTRISYHLTKHGRATVAAASALFAHLNLAALGRAP